MKRVILALLLVTTFACKSDKKTETQDQNTEENEAVKEDVYDGYIISLKAEVLKDDTFLINFLSEYEEGKQFIKKNNIINNVKGQKGVQTINYILPDDVNDIRRLRMNFGKNREQKSILVENITIQKGDKSWVMNSDDINRYFSPNGYLNINNNVYEFIEKDGNYNPFIISKWSIESAINKQLK